MLSLRLWLLSVLLTSVAAADDGFQALFSIDRWKSSSMDLHPISHQNVGSREPFPMPLCFGHKLEEASIATISSWLEAGSLTSHKLVSCYLNRIHQLNKYLK